MTPAPGVRVSGWAETDGARLFAPLELEIGAGQWTCLLGPSGIGKTTILRLIAGLDTGVRFHGEVVAMDGLPLAGRAMFMAQNDLLLPWLDVLGNVGLGARLRGEVPQVERTRSLVAAVGLEVQSRQRPCTLSGGQRQRAALARTLMEDRPIVLLDEPFSALDARNRAEMQELSADLLRGRTVLLVTHDPAEAARLGHRILVMTGAGLVEAPAPAAPPVRPVEDPETLACQGRLLTMLRSAA